ncbi:helix-turn-helix transcriptional regulator [Streptosporangium oxazolinicum]|uniref:Helix-turn-helix transcriptional regulator n=1 Tax=Streptosporangium oxazolinicum TaxID=909287 RepID=A0ABP8AY76_9ACTN
MTGNANQAREALGARLRDLRKDAELTGRELASLAGWQSSKISKIEYGKQAPSEADIRAWCLHTGFEHHVPDLIAAVRTIETQYVEWRRQFRSGTKHRQASQIAWEEETYLFRVFQPIMIPGLLQTEEYARIIFSKVIDFYNIPDDLDSGIQARMERQKVLYRGDRRFHMVVSHAALQTHGAEREMMIGQLERLLTLMTLPRLRLGIIPARAELEVTPLHGYWIFDERMVLVETHSAELKITQPREIELYIKSFEAFARSAVYGGEARSLIAKEASRLANESSE